MSAAANLLGRSPSSDVAFTERNQPTGAQVASKQKQASFKATLIFGIILLAIGGVASYFSISYFGFLGLLKATLISLAGDASISMACVGLFTFIGAFFLPKQQN